MHYILAANLIVLLHFGFVCFVVGGGVLVLRWRRLAWLHIPAALWGAMIEYKGGLCPLTPLEQSLRQAGGEAGYAGGFVEHYILPVLYPDYLTRDVQFVLGTLVVVINVSVYGWLVARHMKRRKRQT